MESFRNQYSIRQGKINLYQRTSQGSKYQSDNWNVRINIYGQKAIRRSLKTTNQDEAELRAEDLYQELLHKTKRGLSLKTKRFGLVCEAYLKHFTEKVEGEADLPKLKQNSTSHMLQQRTEKIHLYIIPLLGDKNLDDITDLDIDDYIEKRKMFYVSGLGSEKKEITYIRDGKKVTSPIRGSKTPAFNTVNKDLTVIRQVFEYARLQRLIDSRQVPVIKNIPKPKNYIDKRPDLTFEEYKLLLQKLRLKIMGQKNPKHKRSHKFLYLYIHILTDSGIRVTEAKNLRFSDCKIFNKDGEQYIKMYVHGKGKSRNMIPLQKIEKPLEILKKLHKKHAELFGWEYSDEMKVFSNDRGKPIGSFRHALDNLLDECGLLYSKDGRKRSGSAFRKLYITMRLTKGGTSPNDLSKNCGTGFEVIQKYYENLQPEHIAKELTRLTRETDNKKTK